MKNEQKRIQLPKQIESNFMETFSMINLYRYVYKVCSNLKQVSSLFHLAAFLNMHKSRLIICEKQDYFICDLRKKITSCINWQILISTSQIDKLKHFIKQRITSFQNLLIIIDSINCFPLQITSKLTFLYQHLKKFDNLISSHNLNNGHNLNQNHNLNHSYNQIQIKNLDLKFNDVNKNKANKYLKSSQIVKNQSMQSLKKDNQQNRNANKDIKKSNKEKHYIQKINKLKKQYKAYKTLNDENQKQFQNGKEQVFKQSNQSNCKYIVKSKPLMTDFNQFTENQDNEATKIHIKMNKSKLSSTFYQTNSMFSNYSFHQSFSKVKNSFKAQQYHQNKISHLTSQVNEDQKKQQKQMQKMFNFLRKGVSKSITFNNSIQDLKHHNIKGNSFIQKSIDNLTNQVSRIYTKKQSFNDNNINMGQMQQIRKKKYKTSKTFCIPINEEYNLLNVSNEKAENMKNKVFLKQQQNQQCLQQKNYKYASKNKNRRKGFSKKRIQQQDQQHFQNKNKKKSQLIDQNIKNQRNYNRTSFFRTSGYLQTQNIENVQKSKFSKGSPFRKKQNGQQLSQKLCPQDELILQQNSEVAKHFSKEKQNNKDGKNIQNISLKDIYQLGKEFFQENKNYHQSKYANYIHDLMKQKYAIYQNQRLDEDKQISQVQNFNKRLKVMQSQMQHRPNKIAPNWFIQNVQSIQMSKKFIQFHNQLGQKQLSKYNTNSNFLNWKQEFI